MLEPADLFGSSVALLREPPDPDPDPDRLWTVAVGAISDDDGGSDRGAVYVLFVRRDGSVAHFQEIRTRTLNPKPLTLYPNT